VKCEGDFLQKRWTKLYDLRCKVAHNAVLSKVDFEDIDDLVAELRPILEGAIRNLPQVSVPAEEVETIAENVATNMNALVGEFISIWRLLEELLFSKWRDFGNLDARTNIREAARSLRYLGRISIQDYAELQYLVKIRNQIVHNGAATFTEGQIRNVIEQILGLMQRLSELEQE